jgi:hypothetical protein
MVKMEKSARRLLCGHCPEGSALWTLARRLSLLDLGCKVKNRLL